MFAVPRSLVISSHLITIDPEIKVTLARYAGGYPIRELPGTREVGGERRKPKKEAENQLHRNSTIVFGRTVTKT